MQIRNSTRRWGIPSRIIHWLTAGILLWTLGLGVYMTNFVADPLDQFALTQVHKSWGFLVFALAVIRVVWLMLSPKRPALPADTPRWQIGAAHASHAVLYLMIFLMPLSGWVMSAAAPIQDLLNIDNKVFDWFVLPDPWVPGVEWIENVAAWVHYWSGILLGLTLLAHIGAALKHHFVEKDDVLKRMTTG
ncbi:cytochrome b [Roseobacter sp. HKCCA0434]|uniref:cytochrome b n=1 Tax=Roseobacter sp. HKCCA0434 TaxID=3079297 RepID=UPI0029058E64|nr:cytochrome b [Roseobacter sp. HKCCA0434]